MRLSIALSPVKSVFSPLLFSGDLQNGMRRAAALGYDGVELNIRDVRREPLDEIIDLTGRLHLDIVALGTGQSYLVDGMSILSPDAKVRERLFDRLKAHIDFGARTGAKLILGGVFGKFDGDEALRKLELNGALALVGRLAAYASRSGVEIVIEPINRYETNFLNTIEQVLSFISMVGSVGIKVLPDAFHMNIEEVDPAAALTRASGMIGHFHLADSNRKSPGSGHIHFPGLLAALESINYRGYLSGEFLPLPDDETAAFDNISHIRTILGNNRGRL